MNPSGSRQSSHFLPQARLPFAAVNRCGQSGYDPELQRHHLLPRQALRQPALSRMIEGVGIQRIGFEDFRRNGILLPARARAALRMGLPLHRGPHRDYNRMVIDRLGMIEAGWSQARRRDERGANSEALMRIALLQRGLRRHILAGSSRVRFNRHDPLGFGRDFALLDAMAEELWILAGA